MDTPVSSKHNCQQIQGRGRGLAPKFDQKTTICDT